jgi:hypothetical protein
LSMECGQMMCGFVILFRPQGQMLIIDPALDLKDMSSNKISDVLS